MPMTRHCHLQTNIASRVAMSPLSMEGKVTVACPYLHCHHQTDIASRVAMLPLSMEGKVTAACPDVLTHGA